MRAIVKYAVLSIACSGVAFSSSAWAQGCEIINGVRACPVGPEPSSGSGSTPAINFRGLFGLDGPSKAERDAQKATALNEEGVAFYKNGDWSKAIAKFQAALAVSPNDNVIQQNLANAQQAQRENDARRAADARAQQQQLAITNQMKASVQDFTKKLTAAPSSGGLDFDGATSSGLNFTASLEPPNTTGGCGPTPSTSVVDACNVPSGLSKDVENAIAGAYKDTPPGVSERVKKGFQAIAVNDLKAAKAWFQDALNRDPNNPNLQALLAAASPTLQGTQKTASAVSISPASHYTMQSLSASAANMNTTDILAALDDIITTRFLEESLDLNLNTSPPR